MKLSTHMIAQVLMAVLQYANMAVDMVPASAKPYVALTIGLCQTVLAFINHPAAPATPAQGA